MIWLVDCISLAFLAENCGFFFRLFVKPLLVAIFMESLVEKY